MSSTENNNYNITIKNCEIRNDDGAFIYHKYSTKASSIVTLMNNTYAHNHGKYSDSLIVIQEEGVSCNDSHNKSSVHLIQTGDLFEWNIYDDSMIQLYCGTNREIVFVLMMIATLR